MFKGCHCWASNHQARVRKETGNPSIARHVDASSGFVQWKARSLARRLRVLYTWLLFMVVNEASKFVRSTL